MPGNTEVCPAAWFVFRCFARFFGSMFFSFFRHWGEVDPRPGRLFISRNFGLLNWLCTLRLFSRPVRFVLLKPEGNSFWLKLARKGGLAPIVLNDSNEKAFSTIISLLDTKEVVNLMIPEQPDQSVIDLVKKFKSTRLTLFMAITGAKTSLPKGKIIARVCEISIFCGMPYVEISKRENALAELELLENSIKHVPLNELPSIFFNRVY